MPVAGPIIGAVGAIGGGAMGANAQANATNAEIQGQRDAMNMQLAMYNQQRADQMPMLQARNAALPLFLQLLGINPSQLNLTSGTGTGGITTNVTGASNAPGRSEHLMDTRRDAFDGWREDMGNGRGGLLSSLRRTVNTAEGDWDRWFGDALVDDPGNMEFSVDNGNAEVLPASGAAYQPVNLQELIASTPGYQFQLGEGMNAIDRSAASRGGLMSGATIKAAQRYGTGLASQEFGNFANRLASLMGLSQSAVGQVGAAGQATGANIGQNLANIGSARGSGYANTGNIWGNAIGSAAQGFGQYYGNQPQTTTVPTGGGGPYNQNAWMNYGYGGG